MTKYARIYARVCSRVCVRTFSSSQACPVVCATGRSGGVGWPTCRSSDVTPYLENKEGLHLFKVIKTD